jgi:hypothetical protein
VRLKRIPGPSKREPFQGLYVNSWIHWWFGGLLKGTKETEVAFRKKTLSRSKPRLSCNAHSARNKARRSLGAGACFPASEYMHPSIGLLYVQATDA